MQLRLYFSGDGKNEKYQINSMMKKTLKIVVLAKQVPDTRNVGKDAMKADGTVNRAALAAIFNPEDLNALEQALVLKDMFPGSRVEILTMGPGRAAEIIREGMFRGADGGVLLTDRKFAGSDTLATSYALSRAALKMNPDIIVAGRQAIDGDTAADPPPAGAWRRDGRLPPAAGDDRQRNGSRVPSAPCEARDEVQACDHAERVPARPGRLLRTAARVAPLSEHYRMGRGGCRCRRYATRAFGFAAKEAKRLSADDADIDSLIKELIASHTLG